MQFFSFHQMMFCCCEAVQSLLTMIMNIKTHQNQKPEASNSLPAYKMCFLASFTVEQLCFMLVTSPLSVGSSVFERTDTAIDQTATDGGMNSSAESFSSTCAHR